MADPPQVRRELVLEYSIFFVLGFQVTLEEESEALNSPELRRADKSVITDDVTELNPIDGHFLRYKWYRVQSDKKVAVCSVHPTEQATLQCLGCVKAKIPVAKSYHCSPKCFSDAWQHHRVLHERAASAVNENGSEDEEIFGRFNSTGSNMGLSTSHSNPNLSNGSTAVYPATVTQRSGGETWFEVGCYKTYTPTADDIGHVLKFECVVVDAETKLAAGPANTLLTSRVIPAPSPSPRRLIIVGGIDMPGHLDLDGRISSAGTFTVLSYNILSDTYATNELYSYCPSWALSWTYRRQNLLREIVGYRADIVCLQEVQSDHFEEFFAPELDKHGYQALFKRNTAEVFGGNINCIDGCATFFRRDRFSHVKKYEVEFNKAAQSLTDALVPSAQKKNALNRLVKDNVALIIVLEAKFNNQGIDNPANSCANKILAIFLQPPTSPYLSIRREEAIEPRHFFFKSYFLLRLLEGVWYQSISLSIICALFIGKGNLIGLANIELEDLRIRDKIALCHSGILQFCHVLLLVLKANTHVNVHQELKDVKLWQVHTLLKGLEKIAASADIPMLVCGDFNSVPGSAPHTLLAMGKVDPLHPDLAIDPLGILRPAAKLTHQLPLVSAYSSFARVGVGLGLEQRRRMDPATNEPIFTNCTRDFIADSLTVESLLELLDEDSLRKDTALPSPEWFSTLSTPRLAILEKRLLHNLISADPVVWKKNITLISIVNNDKVCECEFLSLNNVTVCRVSPTHCTGEEKRKHREIHCNGLREAASKEEFVSAFLIKGLNGPSLVLKLEAALL
ncbi:Carbon catabolite repressor protein 41 [Sesamum angolense]|uniref:poly(A)-specific ribonuclease n=1 Tax=Sesamum angolense TaxID=2727404 RepID=A0AAE1WFF7_9LAMI|nr:Carbon catabolite repressor protein 41 [Sesamum angolense]